MRVIDPADHPDWPLGLTQVDFSELKQKLLGSIVGIAAVDALAWYFDLEKEPDTTKLIWVLAFPLTFAICMLILAISDWLGRRPDKSAAETVTRLELGDRRRVRLRAAERAACSYGRGSHR